MCRVSWKKNRGSYSVKRNTEDNELMKAGVPRFCCEERPSVTTELPGLLLPAKWRSLLLVISTLEVGRSSHQTAWYLYGEVVCLPASGGLTGPLVTHQMASTSDKRSLWMCSSPSRPPPFLAVKVHINLIFLLEINIPLAEYYWHHYHYHYH